MTGLEKILVKLDIGAPGALLRVVLGILLILVVQAAYPEAGLWILSAYLRAPLFGIKVLAAVARRLVSSAFVRSHWEWRRRLATGYDSYQWRKLLWFGLGIMIGAAVGWPGTKAHWILGLAC